MCEELSLLLMDALPLCRSNYMYWTDVTQGKIRRSFLNGSDVMTLLDDEIETPGQPCYIDINK